MAEIRFPLVLDGATGTLLEERNVKMHPRVWSAVVFLDNHCKVMRPIYQEYADSGADILTTVTYQASIPSFDGILSPQEVKAVVKRDIQLALDVARSSGKGKLVAASIGPYGAYLCQGQEYTGDYDVSEKALHDFHLSRLQMTVEGEPDIILFETVPNINEVRTICDLIEEQKPPMPVWLSLSVSISDNVTLADGTSLDEVAKVFKSSRILVVGANCFPVEHTLKVLDAYKTFGLPILISPNSGELYNGSHWDGRPSEGCWNPEGWLQAGASIVGGCCRTGPTHIRKIAKALHPSD